jgi:CDP-glucose 4,6-dehydratase
LSTFESNIKGTWNVLEAARNSKLLKRIVVASSDKAYGSHKDLPYKETAILRGMHPYDASKSCADILSQMYFETYGLPVGITRCGNFYGGGDLNFNRLIPGTIKSILHNSAPVIRSDGTFKRDYIYILDAVDAYLTLGHALDRKDVQGEAFNFSTNNPMSVIEVVNLIIKMMGSKLEPRILNEAKAEIKDQYLNSTKAKEVLGWKAKYVIEPGLKETIKWYKEFFKAGK